MHLCDITTVLQLNYFNSSIRLIDFTACNPAGDISCKYTSLYLLFESAAFIIIAPPFAFPPIVLKSQPPFLPVLRNAIQVNNTSICSSKVNEEKLTVDLENDPRPESLKIAQAVEKNLIDNGYKIASIDFDGYGSALTIKIIMDDNLRVSLVYKSDDTLNSINAFGSNDETLLPMAKVIVGTEILGFSEEDRTAMFNSPDGTFTVGKWAGYIDDSQSSRAGRIFKLYITNK